MAISVDDWEHVRGGGPEAGEAIYNLADPEMVAITAYGLRDINLGEEVARPALFILDGEGIVRWRHITDDWRVRADGDELFARLLAMTKSER